MKIQAQMKYEVAVADHLFGYLTEGKGPINDISNQSSVCNTLYRYIVFPQLVLVVIIFL